MLVVAALPLVAFAAKNRYVSKDLDYGSGEEGEVVEGDLVYNDIQAAVNAASSGDTIWIKDGFVCDTGATVNNGSSNRVCVVGKSLTLRSQSGIVDEAAGKGATIRGNRIGEKTAYVRCFRSNTSATLKGLILENGASEGEGRTGSYAGGAVQGGSVAVEDCVVRNCRSIPLQSVSRLSRTIVEGCSNGPCLNSSTCPVNDCTFRNNTTPAMGYNADYQKPDQDPTTWQVVSNTVFYNNNRVGTFSSHGSYFRGCVFRDCIMTNNYMVNQDATISCSGGAVNGRCYLYHCTIGDNVASCIDSSSGHGGGVCGYALTKGGGAYLYDCEVYGNFVTNGTHVGYGGGVRNGYCYRTKIHGNYVEGYGGGAGNCVLVDCEVYDNEAAVRPGATGSNGGAGGGIANCIATNCTIRDNRAISRGEHSSPGFAGGVLTENADCELVNCLVSGNTAMHDHGSVMLTVGKGKTGSMRLVNCTVAGNADERGICGDVSIINTIVWGNGRSDDTILAATNCCASVLTDATTYPGCITDDPKFDGAGKYLLKAFSPCRNAGYYDADDPAWAWATDSACPASKALNGVSRVRNGAIDMGCYESVPRGMLMLCK